MAKVQVCAGRARVGGVVLRNLAPVDDPGDRREDRPQPAAIRLALGDRALVEQLQIFDPVELAARVEVVEPPQLGFLGRDDQFADLPVRDPLRLAVLPDQLAPLDAQPGLERARLVIDPGVDDAAVVARLVAVEVRLFLDVGELQTRIPEEQLARGRESHDPAADHGDVIGHTGDGFGLGTKATAMLAAPASDRPFRNEPIRTFADPESRAAMETALAGARGILGATYPLIIGAERILRPGTMPSFNPAHPSEMIGDVVAATPLDAGDALEQATVVFPSWSRTPVEERANLLFRAAAALRERKDWFDALLVLEVGKPWVEADADTAEAIDFLEYYAREALRWSQPPALVPSPLPEDNRLRYLPLGPGAVIPPWNFALAIMAGMTAAALVTGNPVVLKPSPDAPVVAAQFVDLLYELGLPPGVLNFVPGDGPTVGEALVTDPTHPLRFVHRLEGGRPADHRARRPDRRRPALDQAGDRRDGRQGRDRRRRRRRPRGGGRGRRRLGLRLFRSEVLGVLARHRRREPSTIASWRRWSRGLAGCGSATRSTRRARSGR